MITDSFHGYLAVSELPAFTQQLIESYREASVQDLAVTLSFLSRSFLSMDIEMFRDICLPLVSLPSLCDVPDLYRQQYLHRHPKIQKKIQSLKSKILPDTHERKWLSGFIDHCMKMIVEADNATSTDQLIVEFCRFCKALLGQLSTRRFLKPILESQCVTPVLLDVCDSDVLDHVLSLKDCLRVPIDDFTSDLLTEEETEDVYQARHSTFRTVAQSMGLADVYMSTASEMNNLSKIEKIFELWDEETIYLLIQKAFGVVIPDFAQSREIAFLVLAYFLEEPSPREPESLCNLRSFDIPREETYSSETSDRTHDKSIFDIIRPFCKEPKGTLMPTGLQFLSVRDIVSREIDNANMELRKKLFYMLPNRGKWAKIESCEITKVGRPLIGETVPECVIGYLRTQALSSITPGEWVVTASDAQNPPFVRLAEVTGMDKGSTNEMRVEFLPENFAQDVSDGIEQYYEELSMCAQIDYQFVRQLNIHVCDIEDSKIPQWLRPIILGIGNASDPVLNSPTGQTGLQLVNIANEQLPLLIQSETQNCRKCLLVYGEGVDISGALDQVFGDLSRFGPDDLVDMHSQGVYSSENQLKRIISQRSEVLTQVREIACDMGFESLADTASFSLELASQFFATKEQSNVVRDAKRSPKRQKRSNSHDIPEIKKRIEALLPYEVLRNNRQRCEHLQTKAKLIVAPALQIAEYQIQLAQRSFDTVIICGGCTEADTILSILSSKSIINRCVLASVTDRSPDTLLRLKLLGVPFTDMVTDSDLD